MNMKHQKQLFTVLLMSAACMLQAQRSETLLEKNWKFSKGDFPEAVQTDYNDTKWESVVIPHDWAIFGPFDMNNDLQNVAVTQNFEKKASLKTGRTGGLPYVGTGWYRTSFDVPADKEVTLLFDGAMSEARVYVNGQEACFWPFGYNSFHCNVTPFLNKDGKNNTLGGTPRKPPPVFTLVSGSRSVPQRPLDRDGKSTHSGMGHADYYPACQ